MLCIHSIQKCFGQLKEAPTQRIAANSQFVRGIRNAQEAWQFPDHLWAAPGNDTSAVIGGSTYVYTTRKILQVLSLGTPGQPNNEVINYLTGVLEAAYDSPEEAKREITGMVHFSNQAIERKFIAKVLSLSRRNIRFDAVCRSVGDGPQYLFFLPDKKKLSCTLIQP